MNMNYSEYSLPCQAALRKVADCMEAGKYEEAREHSFTLLANARLLTVLIAEVLDEHSVELQRVQNIQAVPEAVSRSEGAEKVQG